MDYKMEYKMDYDGMIFVIFSFDDIDENQFILKGAKITNNIKYATHVVIQKANEINFNIVDINDFIRNTNMYVRMALTSLLKNNENEEILWEMITIVIRSLAITNKSDIELVESLDRLCDTISNTKF